MRSRALTAGLPSASWVLRIGAPSFPSGAVTLRQHLAMLVGAFDAAQIGALAGPGAGDEERHIGRLRQLWWRRRLLCALTPDVTPSASAAIISAFDLLISVLPWDY